MKQTRGMCVSMIVCICFTMRANILGAGVVECLQDSKRCHIAGRHYIVSVCDLLLMAHVHQQF
jgi:hypothetical protein